jgi:ribosomal protein S18 acetylase RimI-like enzyme
MDAQQALAFREEVRADDPAAVREIVASTGFFHDHEIDVAVELVDERLQKGPGSGYLFLFAELDGRTVGYSCYGEVACTTGSYDLYWIAVHDDFRGRGIGGVLLEKTEECISRLHGRAIWVETSGREKYLPTRKFYLRNGYRESALLEGFYADGDDKVVYVKRLG